MYEASLGDYQESLAIYMKKSGALSSPVCGRKALSSRKGHQPPQGVTRVAHHGMERIHAIRFLGCGNTQSFIKKPPVMPTTHTLFTFGCACYHFGSNSNRAATAWLVIMRTQIMPTHLTNVISAQGHALRVAIDDPTAIL